MTILEMEVVAVDVIDLEGDCKDVLHSERWSIFKDNTINKKIDFFLEIFAFCFM